MNNRSLFSDIDGRIAHDREDGDLAYFNALMLKLEFTTKIVVSGMVACVRDDVDRHRYSLEHKLVRADSIGTWVKTLNEVLVGTPAQSLLHDAREFARDLTEKVGATDWRHEAVTRMNRAATRLDTNYQLGAKVALWQFFDIGVYLRNRTRGHGAPTSSQCNIACEDLVTSLESVIKQMKLFSLSWVYLRRNLSGKYRVSPLLNKSKPFDYLKRSRETRLPKGVYLHLGEKPRTANHLHLPLIFTDSELSDIWLPNGNFNKNKFEVLSYVTNDRKWQDGTPWSDPPTRLPESETEGGKSLEPIGNTFANLPPMPTGYVPRIDLENQLVKELLNVDRHPIVTLTGPGGIGKTSIAIKAIRENCRNQDPPYEVVLWISARDIDLLDTGPKSVSRRVFTQKDIARASVELLEPEKRKVKGYSAESFFQHCLEKGAAGFTTLFVLDNFETLKNPTDVVEWIDTYIRPPNKVLITTRFRDFRGDYPIEIKGMSDDEASRLIDKNAVRLGVGHLINKPYKTKLIRESDGHPYVIKILLGQVAKENSAVTPKRIVATADHLLDALFRRTYDALSPAAQRIFLLLCSWNVYVPEIAVEAVALRPGTERFDVANALEEAVRFSLIDQNVTEDNERFVGVPLAAAIFGQGELAVSPFKVAVEEDRKLLMDFGAGKRSDAHRGTLPRIENLIKAVAARASDRASELEKNLPILEYLARRVPQAYLGLADLVMEVRNDHHSLKQARNYVRRYIEAADVTERHEAWLKLARLCRQCDDVMGEIHALCETALLPTSDRETLGAIANRLIHRIRLLKKSVEVKELLKKVIRVMENHLNDLSADDCSQLAWLHLNVGNSDKAEHVASVGIEKDSSNDHCQALIRKLKTS